MRRLAPLSLLVLFLSLPLLAQEEPLFIERVDVNVVNVEVFVTDKAGNAVTGLAAEDFEIFEDGQPVEISNFYKVARSDRVLEGFTEDREMVAARDPQEDRFPPAIEKPEDQRLNLVVYMDFFNMRPSSKKRVIDQLGPFLEDRIHQGDNIMLAGFGGSLEVIQPFTRDVNDLARGLQTMKKANTYRQVDQANRRRTIRLMTTAVQTGAGAGGQLAVAGEDFASAYQYVRSYVQEARANLRRSARGIESMVRSLAGLPGRKAMLYVSDGLPQRPGEDLYQILQDLAGANAQVIADGGQVVDTSIEALRQDESALFSSITREANAHQVTLYTMDSRGSTGDSTMSAEFAELAVGPGGRAVLDNLRSASLQEPLVEMAVTTGGESILGTFNFEGALDTLASDLDSFYSLGYNSPRGGDSKYHKIEVKVKRPGLKVRHRSGYVDKPEVERVGDRTLASLLLDVEKNPLGVAVDFGTPEKKGRAFHLPVLIRIPFRDITLLPNGENEEGRLSIFLVVQDGEGRISDLQKFPYPVSIPSVMVDVAREKEIGYETTLAIRKGTPKIVIGVWDELSGTESFVGQRVLVGSGKKVRDAGRKAARGR